MARIKETFNSRSWFMIECDDPNCEQRFDDSQWYADEDDLLAAAKDEGWQILSRTSIPNWNATCTTVRRTGCPNARPARTS